jgi:hypothetical protein
MGLISACLSVWLNMLQQYFAFQNKAPLENYRAKVFFYLGYRMFNVGFMRRLSPPRQTRNYSPTNFEIQNPIFEIKNVLLQTLQNTLSC